uniref:CSON004593 protein n=1 Tax=Culicoides sonorensis TaxID=179676 RepID=A0A336LTN9_CULSO
MAIDLLVGALLLCSASVNLLALGAFWVTPSLRAGLANRFVVNLLIVNLVCCVVLAPSLLLNSITFDGAPLHAITTTQVVTPSSNNNDLIAPSSYVHTTNNETDCLRFNNCTVNLQPTDEIQSEYIRDKFRFTQIRCWGLDFAAAIGALSVLLVVSDTWCAVTDPLRYHTRLSDKKAWIFVFLVWAIGIVFGFASAFRSDQSNSTNEPDDVYNAIFSYTYFFFAILLPFIMVCIMYWRIYNEARESGQRMRQNGSSPLLQSALNLAQVSAATAQTQVQQDKLVLNTGGIITGALSHNILEGNVKNISLSNINNNSDDSDEKEEVIIEPLIPKQQIKQENVNDRVQMNNTYNLNNSHCSERRASDSQQQQEQRNFHLSLDNKPFFKSDDNQNNILLTLTTSTSTEQIRRNFSAKQLVIENLDNRTEMRHATSTPNLHKLDKYDLHPRLVLPLPTVNVPPKALSYMTSIRHRLSNASSLFKYREESRAARISILVVVMFLVSYLPYGILVLMQGHNDFLEASDQSLLAIFAVVLANLSSPFIFAYRNKRVRRGIFRLLGVDKQKAHDRFQKFQNSTIRRKTSNFTNINRSTSRASTYSAASCKYLTVAPHATTLTLNGSYIVEIDKLSPCFEERSSYTASPLQSPVNIAPIHSPYKQTTITINPNNECNNKKIYKKSILKRVCDTSKMWGCNCVDNSSISKSNNNFDNKKLSIKQPTPV